MMDRYQFTFLCGLLLYKDCTALQLSETPDRVLVSAVTLNGNQQDEWQTQDIINTDHFWFADSNKLIAREDATYPTNIHGDSPLQFITIATRLTRDNYRTVATLTIKKKNVTKEGGLRNFEKQLNLQAKSDDTNGYSCPTGYSLAIKLANDKSMPYSDASLEITGGSVVCVGDDSTTACGNLGQSDDPTQIRSPLAIEFDEDGYYRCTCVTRIRREIFFANIINECNWAEATYTYGNNEQMLEDTVMATRYGRPVANIYAKSQGDGHCHLVQEKASMVCNQNGQMEFTNLIAGEGTLCTWRTNPISLPVQKDVHGQVKTSGNEVDQVTLLGVGDSH